MEGKQVKINHSKTFWTTFCKMLQKTCNGRGKRTKCKNKSKKENCETVGWLKIKAKPSFEVSFQKLKVWLQPNSCHNFHCTIFGSKQNFSFRHTFGKHFSSTGFRITGTKSSAHANTTTTSEQRWRCCNKISKFKIQKFQKNCNFG